jgi:ABC-type polysaccharide/polyol phosphate transport system ATPase subunit
MDAIVVRDLTKAYRLGVGRARVREMLPWPIDTAVRRAAPRWWTRGTFNALEDVSVSVRAGESLSFIGHNGAGKTTLLRLIAGITSPTSGRVSVRGRVAALIDVLVGFHPELTGRENVYLLGAIQGFSRREMRRRLDRIFDFAEIDEAADTPLKRYSAGMGARLGFATLTALDPEILLIDEVLAVGDATFQRKCMGWLDGYKAEGRTLIFVSHNLSMVRSMTERAVWLEHGRVKGDGPVNDVIPDYARAMEQRRDAGTPLTMQSMGKLVRASGVDRWGVGGTRVSHVHIEEATNPYQGLVISITYEASDADEAVFCVAFVDESGRDVGSASSSLMRLRGNGGSVRCAIEPFPLRPGVYFPVVAVVTADGRVRDRWRLDRAIVIERNGNSGVMRDFGPVEFAGLWSDDNA